MADGAFSPVAIVDGWGRDDNERMNRVNVIWADWKRPDGHYSEDFVVKLQDVNTTDYIDVLAGKGSERVAGPESAEIKRIPRTLRPLRARMIMAKMTLKETMLDRPLENGLCLLMEIFSLRRTNSQLFETNVIFLYLTAELFLTEGKSIVIDCLILGPFGYFVRSWARYEAIGGELSGHKPSDVTEVEVEWSKTSRSCPSPIKAIKIELKPAELAMRDD